jgi:glycosyltransferase involved in cell wall biosynthesis
MIIGLTARTFHPASGGLQPHAQRLLLGLQVLGHEVRVATRTVRPAQTWSDFYRASEPTAKTMVDGIPVTVLGGCCGAGPLLWLTGKCVVRRPLHGSAAKLSQAVFTNTLCHAFRGVNLIHHVGQAHELIGYAAAAAAKRLKVPFLIQPTLHPGQWGDSAFDLRLYALADRLLAHTGYERDALRQLGLKPPCDVVGNGIEDRNDGCAERFRSRYGLQGPIILFLGRKSSDKGYPLLLESFAKVREAHPAARLVALGPPAGQPSPEVPGLLDFGFASDDEKHDALAACDMLCVPSEGESFGLVFMEAARYGKPSVARNLPVLRELLGNKDAAVLVGPEDASFNQVPVSVDELASALSSLLADPDRARRIGQNAQRVSEEFLWPNVISRFEQCYRLVT